MDSSHNLAVEHGETIYFQLTQKRNKTKSSKVTQQTTGKKVKFSFAHILHK